MNRGTIPAAGTCVVFSLVCILLLLLPAGASAENETVGIVNSTVATPGVTPSVNLSPAATIVVPTSGETSIPFPVLSSPRIVIVRTEINGLNCTVSGTALPGSPNETISSLWWDWGDTSTPEEHGFPHSHTYAGPGTYLLSVTAFQSDGGETTEEETIVIRGTLPPVMTIGIAETLPPFRPEGPDGQASAPVLTLLEPVVDRMNVTVNGNLNAGSPGATIASVSIDWGDGNASNVTDLPATHTFAGAGIFTITITGIQSDQQATTKGITVDIQGDDPGPPGPAVPITPPVNLQEFAILLVIATAAIVAVLVVVGQRYFARRMAVEGIPEIPKAVSIEEARYAEAKERGDLAAASAYAAGCARMFRSLAERDPGMRTIYLELAEKWEEISRTTVTGGDSSPTRRGTVPMSVPPREELERICKGTDVTPDVAESVIRVALEIGREGREGQAVGTSFVVGDTETVLKNSRQFVLNPFHGHDEADRQITDIGIRGNIKEFAQLDGAFIVSGNGIVEAAGRYITVDMSRVKVPGGLGSRHSSIAGITQATRSIGIVVSQSGGLITIFKDGTIVHTIGS